MKCGSTGNVLFDHLVANSKRKNSCTFFKSIKWDTTHSFRCAFRKVDTCFKMKRFLARGIYHSCTENFCKRLH